MRFAPVIYEHAAALIGERPWTVSRSANLLAQAHIEAHRRYGHQPVVVGIDIYDIEPECYGAQVDEPPGSAVPAIGHHPLTEVVAVLDLPVPDWARSGRVPLVLTAARQVAATLSGVPVCVPVCGPFSLITGVLGFESVLMALYETPELVGAALHHLVKGQLALVATIQAAGLGVTLFESAATPPLVSPPLFATVLRPVLQAFCQGASQILGHGVALIIGGDTAPILPELLATGTTAVICPVETDQAAFLAGMRDHLEVAVRVNMDPQVFARQDPSAALAEAERVLALVAGQDRPGLSIGSGVLPVDAVAVTVAAVAARIERG